MDQTQRNNSRTFRGRSFARGIARIKRENFHCPSIISRYQFGEETCRSETRKTREENAIVTRKRDLGVRSDSLKCETTRSSGGKKLPVKKCATLFQTPTQREYANYDWRQRRINAFLIGCQYDFWRRTVDAMRAKSVEIYDGKEKKKDRKFILFFRVIPNRASSYHLRR